MTQLIVSLSNQRMLNPVKSAIGLLRGVASVEVSNHKEHPNAKTLRAMHEAETGDTILCDTIDDYLKLVGDDVQD